MLKVFCWFCAISHHLHHSRSFSNNYLVFFGYQQPLAIFICVGMTTSVFILLGLCTVYRLQAVLGTLQLVQQGKELLGRQLQGHRLLYNRESEVSVQQRVTGSCTTEGHRILYNRG